MLIHLRMHTIADHQNLTVCGELTEILIEDNDK